MGEVDPVVSPSRSAFNFTDLSLWPFLRDTDPSCVENWPLLRCPAR